MSASRLKSDTSHWVQTKIKFIGQIKAGGTPSTNNLDYWDGDIVWLPSGAVQNNTLLTNITGKFITQEGLDNSATKEIQEDSILVALAGATCANIAHLKFAATANQSVVAIETLASVSTRFLFYSLLAKRHDILRLKKGGAMSGINTDDVKNLQITLPPESEQKIISNILDNKISIIEDKIKKNQELLDLLKEKRSATITKAITKGLNPDVLMKDSGIDWLGDIPAHWKIGKIKQFSTLITSGPRGWSDLINDEGDSIFLQSGDLDDSLGLCIGSANKITPPANMESKRSKMSNGDIVVCITGANTGRVAVASNIHDDVYINQHLSLIKLNNEKLDSAFVGFQLKSEAGKEYFKTKQYGLKEGLSLGDVGETIVVFPELEEQKVIGTFISEQNDIVDNLVSVIKSAITNMKKYRTALISAAVTGEIDVRESV